MTTKGKTMTSKGQKRAKNMNKNRKNLKKKKLNKKLVDKLRKCHLIKHKASSNRYKKSSIKMNTIMNKFMINSLTP